MSVSFTKVECVMSYFKKFGDFCSGFACFSAIIYLFRQYMMFDAKDAELMEKLMPDAGKVVLKNCGHYSFIDDMYTFNRVLASFMNIPL